MLEKRDFAALLVGQGQDILESGIALPQLVLPPLLSPDVLLSDGLFPAVGKHLGQVSTQHPASSTLQADVSNASTILLPIIQKVLVIIDCVFLPGRWLRHGWVVAVWCPMDQWGAAPDFHRQQACPAAALT